MEKVGTTKVGTREEILAKMKEKYVSNAKILAFYNSVLDMIIEDTDLMVIPVEDRQFHRGHAVFDTARVENGQIVALDVHMARFQRSAKLAQIEPPMPFPEIQKKIVDTIHFAYKKAGSSKDKILHVRYWLSKGIGGGFSIAEATSTPTLYCSVFEVGSAITSPSNPGVKEFTIWEYPAKTGILANAKTNNYLINALVATRTKELGGYQGVQVNPEGYITECAVANIAFVWDNDEFVVPNWETILKGTTADILIQLIQEKLVPAGLVKNVVFRNIRPEEVYQKAKEMIVIGYDNITPIIEYDGRKVGNGAKGAVCEKLQELTREYCKTKGIPLDSLTN
eukprot:TRINITY_DN4701_c0_g2_i5.p1 TRINITY_DN4701_c0_g2~~TRINITY_DN4701_c0_g2_i5.p1  ORF type:complete len:338 (+),score=81.40 TRINITY_DN4701_c0_g2_i5:39-1052(+)